MPPRWGNLPPLTESNFERLVKAVHHRRKPGPGGGTLRVQPAVSGAVEDAIAHSLGQSLPGVAGNGGTVGIGGALCGLFSGQFLHLDIALNNGHQLLAADGGAGSGAVGDATLSGPATGSSHITGSRAGQAA